MNRVFVYGTLKSGGESRTNVPRRGIVGKAKTISDYEMYDLGAFQSIFKWQI